MGVVSVYKTGAFLGISRGEQADWKHRSTFSIPISNTLPNSRSSHHSKLSFRTHTMKSLTQHLLALVVLAAGLLAAPLGIRSTEAIPTQAQEQERVKGRRGEGVVSVKDAKNEQEEDWVAPEGVNTACFVM
ncbi:hypothetical protein ONS95_002316 [Cadophora gregata]|uniref:uncharacterized protein n=1 Tax=Cadophora gregata TaxID=51156 RepID=UPI0026DCFB6F|nr:uncharacterized protein ONS95_002316 [Cadophora gregata]KAK0109635.1 hypothetical protein ONS95_002316 [Cadophora gregata]KAK0110734.1 hypothetical protein ONS96_002333 [Cadophora gregata f. sp. sojae]